MNAVEIYEKASCDVEHSKITLGEFEERIKPLYDVEPVRHGHWKVVNDSYGGKAYICECSECEDTVWVYKDADRKWNYCPNCGARMDGEERKPFMINKECYLEPTVDKNGIPCMTIRKVKEQEDE